MLRLALCSAAAALAAAPASAATYSAKLGQPASASASSPATSSGIAGPPPARAPPTKAARSSSASRSPSAPAASTASSSTAARSPRPSSTSCNAVGQGRAGARRSPRNKSPPGPRVSTPSARRPHLLSRLHKSAASPHLRRVLRQYELVEKVRSYDPDADEGLINRAYVFSMKAHGSQKRASGDPYFSHPIEVAGILTDLKLDDQTIVTAILHDTIEDTLATPEEIEKLFGKDVARLVDGVTKLSKIEAQIGERARRREPAQVPARDVSDDIRVLLVKLADRLHNMRTLHHIPSEDKRRRIARETMDIYAPLAERIGMYEMMTEMQTLAFRELEPDAYASITRRLKQLTESGRRPRQPDRPRAAALSRRQRPRGRGHRAARSIPISIWKKMAERHISFEQLSDVMAFRDHRRRRRRMLPRARPDPPPLADGPGPVQGLHLDPQAQRLPLAAHLGHPRFARCGSKSRSATARCTSRPSAASPPTGPTRKASPSGDIDDPVGRRPGRDPRPCREPRGAARAYPDGDVPGPHLRLHPEGRADPAAQGRDPGRFRLCGPHRPWRPDRRRQGQRPRRAAADDAREWRPGRNPRLRSAAPAAELAALRRHRQGARRRPPLRPPQGARGDGRARPQDLRRDRRSACPPSSTRMRRSARSRSSRSRTRTS